MVDFRTNYAKDISSKVKETYGASIPIFESVIPVSVKAAEASAEGISIYGHCINCKVSAGLDEDIIERSLGDLNGFVEHLEEYKIAGKIYAANVMDAGLVSLSPAI